MNSISIIHTKTNIVTTIIAATLTALILMGGSVYAQDVQSDVGAGAAAGAATGQQAGGPQQLTTDLNQSAQQGVCDVSGNCGTGTDVSGIAVKIINFLLYAIGILSVIMIIIGGLRYVVSAGDATAVKGAKDTILYAIVGLVVAFVAWGIVNFVTSIFTTP